jgi:hypothetical protein
VAPPAPERRIAHDGGAPDTYAVLLLVLAVPGGITSTFLLDGPSKDRVVNLLLRERFWEATMDARLAYHDLLGRFLKATTATGGGDHWFSGLPPGTGRPGQAPEAVRSRSARDGTPPVGRGDGMKAPRGGMEI